MQAVLAALRDAEWLNGRRARVYPRLLLAASVGLALIWIVAARGGVDLAGKPLGTDFLSFFAASELALQGRAARRLRRRGALGGAEGAVRPRGRLFRLLLSAALSARLPAARAHPLFRLADRLAGGDRLRLLARAARLGRAALGRRGPARLPRLPGQRRPRAERLLERGADRRRRAVARPTADRRRPAVRRARLQAATGADDPDRADRVATLDDLRRRRRLRRGAVRGELSDLGRAGLARLPRRFAFGARGARAPSRRRREDAERLRRGAAAARAAGARLCRARPDRARRRGGAVLAAAARLPRARARRRRSSPRRCWRAPSCSTTT